MPDKTKKQQDKIAIPEESYSQPSQIVGDKTLSWDEKMAALQNWEVDEKAALTADDENMTALPLPGAFGASGTMLAKIHTAEREFQETTPYLDAKNPQEPGLLTALVAMHIDACIFYRKSASFTEHDDIEKIFYALEKLHVKIISSLNLAITRENRVLVDAEPLYMSRYRAFHELDDDTALDLSAAAITKIMSAEDICHAALKETLDDETISSPARFHVSCASHLQQKRHTLLNALASHDSVLRKGMISS